MQQSSVIHDEQLFSLLIFSYRKPMQSLGRKTTLNWVMELTFRWIEKWNCFPDYMRLLWLLSFRFLHTKKKLWNCETQWRTWTTSRWTTARKSFMKRRNLIYIRHMLWFLMCQVFDSSLSHVSLTFTSIVIIIIIRHTENCSLLLRINIRKLLFHKKGFLAHYKSAMLSVFRTFHRVSS